MSQQFGKFQLRDAPALHPVLVGVYPVLALAADNMAQIQLRETWHALLFSLLGSVGLLVLSTLVIRNWKRAALACSLTLALFFSYGHVYLLLQSHPIGGLYHPWNFARADILAAIYAAVLILGYWWLGRRLRKLAAATQFINTVMMIAILIPLLRMTFFLIQNGGLSSTGLAVQTDQHPSLPNNSKVASENFPDIYYIILDGYARQDVLQKIYQYDNREFLNFLQAKGFYIAANSHSNYMQTALSMASTFNYEYLDGLAKELPQNSVSRSPLVSKIHHNKLRQFLSAYGYQWVAYSSGYDATEFTNADVYLTPGAMFNSFELSLLTGSAAVLWLNQHALEIYHRQMQATLDLLENPPEMKRPRFVFAHITLPHPPFVFDAQGNQVAIGGFFDGNYFLGTREEYITGYRQQLIYVNQVMERVITNILENSLHKPVIILQADHGPGAYLNWDDARQTCHWERLSILNAYYLPADSLYAGVLYRPDITPVNTFRVILDAYFNAGLGLLDDRSYYSGWNSPYNFLDVTEQLAPCQIPP